MLPTDASERKKIPMYQGLITYFPDALAAVARVSYEGSVQHHPDRPIHWDREKSGDDKDALVRHLVEGDWAKVAWRALAALQKEVELDQGVPILEDPDMEEMLDAEAEAEGRGTKLPVILEEFLRSEGVLEEYLSLLGKRGYDPIDFDHTHPATWIYDISWGKNDDVCWISVDDRWLAHLKELNQAVPEDETTYPWAGAIPAEMEEFMRSEGVLEKWESYIEDMERAETEDGQ